MSFDWKEAVGTVAPILGTVLTGGNPLAGAAIKTVCGIFGIDSDTPDAEKQLEQAVKNATPEQLLALKKEDHEYKKYMKQLQLDITKTELADTADARKMYTDTSDHVPQYFIMIVVMLSWVVMNGYCLYEGSYDPATAGLLQMASSYVGTVIQFFLGTNRSSLAKNTMIQNSVPITQQVNHSFNKKILKGILK